MSSSQASRCGALPHAMEQPYPPTPAHQRLPAMRAYLDGEALCDAGKTVAGIALMRKATYLSWELGTPDWPGWATALYAQLMDGAPAFSPPPVLSSWAGDHAAWNRFVPEAVQTALARRPTADVDWWSSSAAADAVASALASQHFVALDCFAGIGTCRRFRATCEKEWAGGERFRPAKVAEPGGGVGGQRSALARSDYLAWVDVGALATPPSDEQPALDDSEGDGWRALADIVLKADALVRMLRERLLQHGASVTRQRPQVARYGLGDAFARHCDNYCPAGKPASGPHCNGRWLTAVYYSSERWEEGEGGCLRIYRPQGATHGDGDSASPDEQASESSSQIGQVMEDDALLDVAPIADRMLFFLSDFRCPHAVLPVRSERARYAATLWYMHASAENAELERPLLSTACAATGAPEPAA